MEKAKWKAVGYGIERLDLGIFEIHVSWRDGGSGYGYSYLMTRSENPYQSMDVCKKAAILSVKEKLQGTLDLLPD